MRNLLLKLLVAISFIVSCEAGYAAQSYTITEIDNLEPVDINNSGMIFGNGIADVVECKSDIANIYVWSKNTGLIALAGFGESKMIARKINNLGQCIGESYNSKTGQNCARWDNDRNIHALPSTMWKVCGINDSGQVIGINTVAGGRTRAAIVDSSGNIITELQPLPDDDDTQAGAINKYGWAVGQSTDKTGASRQPVLWIPDNDGPLLMETLDSKQNYPYDINDKGVSVGYVCTSGKLRAVQWDANGHITELGWDGVAYAINNSGVIVGDCGHAMIWKKGVMTDLNTLIPEDSGWVLLTAAGINDSGCIVGKGTLNGEQKGYLLTPCL